MVHDSDWRLEVYEIVQTSNHDQIPTCTCTLGFMGHTDWGQGSCELQQLWDLFDKCCYGVDGVIKMRKAQLQNEEELEKVKKKRRLDFLDILLFAKVSGVQG